MVASSAASLTDSLDELSGLKPKFPDFEISSNISFTSPAYPLPSNPLVNLNFGFSLIIVPDKIIYIFSHKNFLFLNNVKYMVQIKNKRKLKWALSKYKKREIKQVFAAIYLGITTPWSGKYMLYLKHLEKSL